MSVESTSVADPTASQGAQGPNAAELAFAFNVAADEDPNQPIDVKQEEAALLEAEQDDNATEQLPEAGVAPGSSNAAKRKKQKSKLAKKLKQKFQPSTSNADATTVSADTDEPVPDQMFQALKAQVEQEHGSSAANKLTPEMISMLLKKAKLDDVARGKAGIGGTNKKDMADYKFWDTQPVPKLGSTENAEDRAIEPDKPASEIRQEPYPMREPYEWSTVDLDDEEQLQEVYNLLTKHYVEDDDASFRFDYSAEFIRWALKPPGFVKEWHVGIRAQTTKKLVAFIAGIPMDLRVRQTVKKCSEINYLCVHKKLRANRLAPLLIQEVTRRCNLAGVFQAVYTAGVFLPTPIARCQYYHRTLNPKKLVATGFTSLPRHQTMSSMIKATAVPTETSVKGLREMQDSDVASVAKLIRSYMSRFDISPIFSDEEVRHNFISGMGKGDVANGRRQGQVTWSFVAEDSTTGAITDFFSFYHLPSTAIKANQIVDAAYLFYYATSAAPASIASEESSAPTTSAPSTWESETGSDRVKLKKRLTELMRDALTVAKQADFDVFNALTLLDNTLFVHDLKFGPGDGFLHYYLYNWITRPIGGGIPDMENQVVSSPQAGLSQKEIGSGVGVVML